jgi:translation initiation factor IF-3
LKLKIEKAKELLQKGYGVRFTLRLRWRENIFKDQSKEKLQHIADELKEYGKSTGVKEEWKGLSLVLFAKLK